MSNRGASNTETGLHSGELLKVELLNAFGSVNLCILIPNSILVFCSLSDSPLELI